MKKKEVNIVRFDWAIKRLLRQKANFEILAGFLSELLKEDIKITEILESESNKETSEDKFNRVDLLVKNSKDELMIIEVQYNSEVDYFQRMHYGVCKTVSQTLAEGAKYRELKKVYSINIVYFDLGEGTDYICHGTTSFKGLHTGEQLVLSKKQRDMFQKTYPSELFAEYYILSVNKFNDVAKNTLDEWIYCLKNSVIQPEFTAKGLAKAKKTLDELRMTKGERMAYEAYMSAKVVAGTVLETAELESFDKGQIVGIEKGKIEGEIVGIEKGKIVGKMERTIEMILAGAKKGASLEFLSDISELSLAEVQQIIDTETTK